jgi:hypothetical protein
MKNIFICFCIALTFASCNRKNETENLSKLDVSEKKKDISFEQMKVMTSNAAGNGTSAMDSTKNPTSPSGIALQGGQVAPPLEINKKIIKTATMHLEVKDFAKYNDMVHKSLRQYGAYIAQEDQSANDYSVSNNISIKVPVDQFEDMLNALPSDAKLLDKKITSEDVTGEVVDIKSRMEAKKQMRARYLEFMKQAKNMEEVLSVQASINDIQADIESADGRVDYLSHNAAYSTINLSFSSILDANKKEEAEPNFASRLGASIIAGGKGLGEIVIALFALWPLFLLIGLGVFVFKKISKTKSVATTTVHTTDKA